MKFSAIATTLFFAATVSAQEVVRGVGGNCGFPGGKTCVSVGKNDKGQTLFTDPAGSPGPNCCLFPARCGNGDGDGGPPPCVFVGGPPPAGKGKKADAKNRKRRLNSQVEAEA
ncbi:hypothetical protein MAPG_11730 [Magnaporthiopsis poae ATCC 64411]|uniref:Uncharacterized protein n=1 Tax=Magnaporthiopsis poae (strain ATCC 64411 / 73-15) TaxID=644358 RepID=A0A0C4EG16_MAGP6|nr:hypothetical protein MAPG_11730 [Magnaporthiopsis poae ATCC 64411]